MKEHIRNANIKGKPGKVNDKKYFKMMGRE